MADAELESLRHRIRSQLTDRNQHFKCNECGVGINPHEETFIIGKEEIQVLCAACSWVGD